MDRRVPCGGVYFVSLKGIYTGPESTERFGLEQPVPAAWLGRQVLCCCRRLFFLLKMPEWRRVDLTSPMLLGKLAAGASLALEMATHVSQ